MLHLSSMLHVTSAKAGLGNAELEGDGLPEGLVCGLLDFLLLCMERLVNRHAATQAPKTAAIRLDATEHSRMTCMHMQLAAFGQCSRGMELRQPGTCSI